MLDDNNLVIYLFRMDTDNSMHVMQNQSDMQNQQHDIYGQYQDMHAEQFQEFQQIDDLNINTDGHNTAGGYGI